MRGMIVWGAALMLLAACNEGATSDEASGPAASRESAAAAPDAPPVPGKLQTFGDWAVGCDNVAACKAVALGPEGGQFPAVLMSIARGGGQTARSPSLCF